MNNEIGRIRPLTLMSPHSYSYPYCVCFYGMPPHKAEHRTSYRPGVSSDNKLIVTRVSIVFRVSNRRRYGDKLQAVFIPRKVTRYGPARDALNIGFFGIDGIEGL